MVVKNKNSTKIFINCDCGCSGIEISKFEYQNCKEKEYYIYHFISSFDAEQTTIFYKIKRTLKIIYNILTTGFYLYNQICLTEKQFVELKEEIIKFE